MRRLGQTALVLFVLIITMFSTYYWLLPGHGSVMAEMEPLMLQLSEKDKVLVFAPHPDDESVGTAGFIQRATAAGSTVKVVFLTCGDAFRYAAQRHFHVVRTNSKHMQALGRVRQGEALSALSLLGVPAENVLFLGYPDGGLAPLWQQHWSVQEVYRSPYTGVDVSPYNNSFTPEVAYSGQPLMIDIEALLRIEKPTIILFPSNYEGHPDHWATHAFVTYALEDLKLHGWEKEPQIYNYLVHYNDWPRPWGANFMRTLEPPTRIAHEGQWLSLPLSWSERTKKYNAILKHRSQVAVMRGFLTSFARATELFQGYPSAVTLRSSPVNQQTVLATDAHGDSLIDRLDRYADIVRLTGSLNDADLRLTLSLRGYVKPELRYELEVVTLGGQAPGLRLRLCYPMSEFPMGITAEQKGDSITFTISRSVLKDAPLLFVSAETYQGQARADRLRQIRVQLN